MRRTYSAPARPGVRQVLRTHQSRLDALLVQWSASGRLTGSVAPRPDPDAKPTKVTEVPASAAAAAAADGVMSGTDGLIAGGVRAPAHRPSPRLTTAKTQVKPKLSPFQALEKTFDRASKLHAKVAMELKLAESKRKEAQAAVDEAAETGGKKKAKGAPSDEELQEELMACNEASAKLQERTDDAKRVMDAASTELQAAKAELEAKEKLERVTALETRLRSIHLNTTGRVLPCRLPGLLDEAHQQVICHPEQIFMKSDDLKAMMEAISFEQGLTRQERLALRESTKSLNVIFRRLVQQQTDMAEARLADSTLTPKQQLEVAKQLELQKRRHKQGLVSYEVVRLHCGLNPPSPRPLRAQQRPASAMELRRPGDVSTPGHRPAPPRPQSGHPLSR